MSRAALTKTGMPLWYPMHEHSWRKAAPFAVAAVLLAAAFAAVYFFFVRTHTGQLIDQSAFDGAGRWRSQVTAPVHAFLDAIPVGSALVALVIALFVLRARRNWLIFFVGAGAVAAANVSTQVLKYLILERPHTGVNDFLDNSLPSGHTTVAASAALLVFLISSPQTRTWAAGIGAAFAAMAGASTLVDQWHRPSDVVAALFVVAFWGCVAGGVLALLPATQSRNPGGPTAPALVPALWACLVSVLVVGLSFALIYLFTVHGRSHLFIAYAGGVLAMIATCLVLAVCAVRLFRWLR